MDYIVTPNPFDCAVASQNFAGPGVYLLGFPFDGTACFRKGARFGPHAIRQASPGIETYSPYLDDDLADHQFFDLGDLSLTTITHDTVDPFQAGLQHFIQLHQQAACSWEQIKLLTMGGEHSISYPMIKSYLHTFPDLLVVHLDAHADLRDGYEGFHYSHASIIRRILDHFEVGHQLLQYGIRSGTKEEYQWMRNHQTIITDRGEFFRQLESISAQRPIYLTLDLDFFDPAFLPGTGTPEAGGEDFHTFVKICKILRHKNLVGADVVELAPPLDPTGNSNVLAAKVVRELLLVLIGGISD